MTTELLSVSQGGITAFRWPSHCAACSRKATHSLVSGFSATSDSKFMVVYASWRELRAEIKFPVCSLHWAAYWLPIKLTGMSLWHKVGIAIAAMLLFAGVFGFARLLLGNEPWSMSALQTNLLLLVPLVSWSLARHFTPVRISDFQPPKLWLRFKRDSYAKAFQEINSSVSVVRQ